MFRRHMETNVQAGKHRAGDLSGSSQLIVEPERYYPRRVKSKCVSPGGFWFEDMEKFVSIGRHFPSC